MTHFTKATLNDIPLIQELAQRSWKTTYTEILSNEQLAYMMKLMYSHEEIASHLHQENYPYYVVFYNEMPAGFLGFEFHFKPRTTKLHRIYLLPETQGKGVGKSCIWFLKNMAASAGDDRIVLAVNKHNKAQHFYKSQGFEIYDDGVFDIGNGFVMDDFLMELRLT